MSTIMPEGYYNGIAVERADEDGNKHKVRWGISSGEKKTRQILVYFLVTEGEWKGTILPWFGYFSKAAAKRTVESLRYMGFKGDDLFSLGDQALDQEVSLKVGHNEYDDKTYPRVDFVNKLGGGVMKMKNPMSDKDVRNFAARMKASCKGIAEHEGEPSSASKGSSGDDHPFNPQTQSVDGFGDDNGAASSAGFGDPEDDIPFAPCFDA